MSSNSNGSGNSKARRQAAQQKRQQAALDLLGQAATGTINDDQPPSLPPSMPPTPRSSNSGNSPPPTLPPSQAPSVPASVPGTPPTPPPTTPRPVDAMDDIDDDSYLEGDLVSLRLQLQTKDAEIAALNESLAQERAHKVKVQDDLEQTEAQAQADHQDAIAAIQAEHALKMTGLKATIEAEHAGEVSKLRLAMEQSQAAVDRIATLEKALAESKAKNTELVMQHVARAKDSRAEKDAAEQAHNAALAAQKAQFDALVLQSSKSISEDTQRMEETNKRLQELFDSEQQKAKIAEEKHAAQLAQMKKEFDAELAQRDAQLATRAETNAQLTSLEILHKEELAALKKELATGEKKIAELKAQLTSLQSSSTASEDKTKIAELTALVSKLQSDAAESLAKNEEIQKTQANKLASLIQTIDALEAEAKAPSAASVELKELQADLLAAEEELKTVQTRETKLQEKVKELEAQLVSETDKLQKQLDESRATAQVQATQHQELEAKLQVELKAANAKLAAPSKMDDSAEVLKLREELTAAKAQLAAAAQSKTNDGEVSKLQEELKAAQEQLATQQKANDSEFTKLKEELATVKSQLSTEATNLEEQLSVSKASEAKLRAELEASKTELTKEHERLIALEEAAAKNAPAATAPAPAPSTSTFSTEDLQAVIRALEEQLASQAEELQKIMAAPSAASAASGRRGMKTQAELAADLLAKQTAIKTKAQINVLQSLVDELREKSRVQEENHAISLDALKSKLQLEFEKELEVQEKRLRHQHENELKEKSMRYDIALEKAHQNKRLSESTPNPNAPPTAQSSALQPVAVPADHSEEKHAPKEEAPAKATTAPEQATKPFEPAADSKGTDVAASASSTPATSSNEAAPIAVPGDESVSSAPGGPSSTDATTTATVGETAAGSTTTASATSTDSLPSDDPFVRLTPTEQHSAYKKQVEHVAVLESLFEEATAFIVDKEAKLVAMIEQLNVDNDSLHQRAIALETENSDLTASLADAQRVHAALEEARVASIIEYQEEVRKLVEEILAMEKENENSKLLLATAPSLNPVAPSTPTPTPTGGFHAPSVAELQQQNGLLKAKVEKLQLQMSNLLSEQDKPAFVESNEYEAPRSPPGQQTLFGRPSSPQPPAHENEPPMMMKSVPTEDAPAKSASSSSSVSSTESTTPALVDLKILVTLNPDGSPAEEASTAALTQHVADLTSVVQSLRLRSEWLEEELAAKESAATAAANDPVATSGDGEKNKLQQELDRAALQHAEERVSALQGQLAAAQAKNEVLTETVASLRTLQEQSSNLQQAQELNKLVTPKNDSLLVEQLSKQLSEQQEKYSILLAEFQATLHHAEQNDIEYKSAVLSLQKHYESEMDALQAKQNKLERDRAEELAQHEERVAQLAQQLQGGGGAGAGGKKIAPTEERVAKSTGAPTSDDAADSTSSSSTTSTNPAAQFELLQKQAARLHLSVESLTDSNKKLESDLRILTSRNEQQHAQISVLQSSAVSTASAHAAALAQTQSKVDELTSKLASTERDHRAALIQTQNAHAGELDALSSQHQSQISDLRNKLSRKDMELLEASSSKADASLAGTREKQLLAKMDEREKIFNQEVEQIRTEHQQKVQRLESKFTQRESQFTQAQKEQIQELELQQQKQVEKLKKDHSLAVAELESNHSLALAAAQSTSQREATEHQLALQDLQLQHKQALSKQKLDHEAGIVDLNASFTSQTRKLQSDLTQLQSELTDLTQRLQKQTEVRKDLESQLGNLESEQRKREKHAALEHERALHDLQVKNLALQRQFDSANSKLEEQRGVYESNIAATKQTLAAAEAQVLQLRQDFAQLQSNASSAEILSSKKLSESESKLLDAQSKHDRVVAELQTRHEGRIAELQSLIKDRDAKIEQLSIELHDLLRIRTDRAQAERKVLATHAADAEAKGTSVPTVLREDESALESLSPSDLLTRYRSLRFSYDAHINHAQELSHTLTLSFEKEIQSLQKKLSQQDQQYQIALATLKEKHSSEIASLQTLHSKLKSEYESKERSMYQEIQILNATLKKLSVSGSVPSSPRGGASGSSFGSGGANEKSISTSHSLLLTEYQSLYQNYIALQSSYQKAQASNDAYVAKLESAKKLVIALNNERKELLEWKKRKRVENEKLRSEAKQYYLAYVQATSAQAASNPLSSPLGSPQGSPQAGGGFMSPQSSAHNTNQIIEHAGLLSPSVAKALDRQPVEVATQPHQRRLSLLQGNLAEQLNGVAHSNGTSYSAPLTKGSSITLIPSTSSSSSGYALRMSTELVVVRDLELDILPFFYYNTAQAKDVTIVVSDAQMKLNSSIEREVSILLEDYSSWAKQLEAVLAQENHVHGIEESNAKKQKTRLLSDLLTECRRVSSSSSSRQDSIIQLIASTFHQAAKQRVANNGGHMPPHGNTDSNAPTVRESQFVLQSDLQLVYVGGQGADIRHGLHP